MLSYIGDFTVYFNRHAEYPRVWSISLPSCNWELEVCEVRVTDVFLATRYTKPTPGADHTLAPVAWLAGHGRILIDDAGTAFITPATGVAQVA